MRTYTTEQQHHALRIASSRELTNTESTALIRGVEAYRDAETEIAQLRISLASQKELADAAVSEANESEAECIQLRGSLATVAAERDTWRKHTQEVSQRADRYAAMHDGERTAHAATQGHLQSAREMRDTYHRLNLEAREELAETRKALELQTELKLIALRGEQTARAALARSEARVKDVEGQLEQMTFEVRKWKALCGVAPRNG